MKQQLKTNTIRFDTGGEITYCELPEGYFYKGHFYTESKIFNVLKKENEVGVRNFYNGVWKYNDYCFVSLEELYEYFENEIAMPYEELKKHYAEIGVYHDPKNCTMYYFYEDEEHQLYRSKKECLLEMRNAGLIEDETDREDRYLDGLTFMECMAYFKKLDKERIKTLEEMA